MLMIQVNVGVTLTADYYVRLSHGFLHFVELSYHFGLLQEVGHPLIGESNSSDKTVV